MSKTILIVDDSEGIRTILKMTLEFKGYNILEAEDGQRAYETLKETTCDLVITDLAMPRMTGLELLVKIRKELQNTDMPVIICTAEKGANEEEFLQKGANKIMTKPVAPFDLLGVVEALI